MMASSIADALQRLRNLLRFVTHSRPAAADVHGAWDTVQAALNEPARLWHGVFNDAAQAVGLRHAPPAAAGAAATPPDPLGARALQATGAAFRFETHTVHVGNIGPHYDEVDVAHFMAVRSRCACSTSILREGLRMSVCDSWFRLRSY